MEYHKCVQCGSEIKTPHAYVSRSKKLPFCDNRATFTSALLAQGAAEPSCDLKYSIDNHEIVFAERVPVAELTVILNEGVVGGGD